MSEATPPANTSAPASASKIYKASERAAAGQNSLEFTYENGTMGEVVMRLPQDGTLRVSYDGSGNTSVEYASPGQPWKALPGGTSQFAVKAGDGLRIMGWGSNPRLSGVTFTWSYV